MTIASTPHVGPSQPAAQPKHLGANGGHVATPQLIVEPAHGINARRTIIDSLAAIARSRGPSGREERIVELCDAVEGDLNGIETDLTGLNLTETPMHDSAQHLLRNGGKRLRPLCVALAARIGTRSSDPAAVRDLAVAAELVHNAALLHDDVVDVGDQRRGAPAARVIYGNAASVYAGDWLLVEAMMRIRRSGFDGLLDQALAVLAEMLEAEALQLERRGRIDASLEDYLHVIDGKTASLFRWALLAGGRAGGLSDSECDALQRFGSKLGIAFQVIDDVLDVDGSAAEIGKELFADLREGKLTYPLMVALSRREDLRADLAGRLADGAAALDDATARHAVQVMRESGGIDEARAFATRLIAEASAALNELPTTPATDLLAAVAVGVTARRS
jgi:octaprenyl-diphosphate synthase